MQSDCYTGRLNAEDGNCRSGSLVESTGTLELNTAYFLSGFL